MITLEGWVEIMYYVMDAHSFYNFIYFILLIIVSIRASSGPWTTETRDGQCPQEALRAGGSLAGQEAAAGGVGNPSPQKG